MFTYSTFFYWVEEMINSDVIHRGTVSFLCMIHVIESRNISFLKWCGYYSYNIGI